MQRQSTVEAGITLKSFPTKMLGKNKEIYGDASPV